MSHVRIQSFAAGYAEDHRTEHHQAVHMVFGKKLISVNRIESDTEYEDSQ